MLLAPLPTEPPASAPDEAALLARLRDGDAPAFDELVTALSPSLRRVARAHVPSDAVADEVVQETWLGVINGLERFEGRASLKTWIFRILLNRARTRGVQEHRTVPFATLAGREAEEPFSAVDADRFLPADHERAPRHWATPPQRWEELPEQALQNAETLAVVREALATLPPAQRLVVTMRDIEGFPSDEVCELLDLSEGNQRVLLHRGRSRVRARLEEHLAV